MRRKAVKRWMSTLSMVVIAVNSLLTGTAGTQYIRTTTVQAAEVVATNIKGDKKFAASDAILLYNGSTVKTSQYPIIRYNGVEMIAIKPLLCDQNPKVNFVYSEITKRIRLTLQNSRIAFKVGSSTMQVNGKDVKMDTPAIRLIFKGDHTSTVLVPGKQICESLGMNVSWDEDEKSLSVKKKAVTFEGEKEYTTYGMSLASYATRQYKNWNRFSTGEYRRLLNKGNDTSNGFQFLRIDRYREVDEKKYKMMLQYVIRDYCLEAGISYKKSVLYDKADVFLAAAKKYNLDPVYLACQTFHESAFGTSELASGTVITKVAYPNMAMGAYGKLKTKALKNKVKVYNLYGIKAIDTDPKVGGTSYAFYQGWTTANKAIYGAAKYLSDNYIYSRYKQNTLFKMRYNPKKSNIWHQYATASTYAQDIGVRMYLFSSCYSAEAEYLYDYPEWSD